MTFAVHQHPVRLTTTAARVRKVICRDNLVLDVYKPFNAWPCSSLTLLFVVTAEQLCTAQEAQEAAAAATKAQEEEQRQKDAEAAQQQEELAESQRAMEEQKAKDRAQLEARFAIMATYCHLHYWRLYSKKDLPRSHKGFGTDARSSFLAAGYA